MKIITEETAKTVVTTVVDSVVLPALDAKTESSGTEELGMEQIFEPFPEADRCLPSDEKNDQREEVRHILLGSPEAIRQTMHQLHVLNYAESLLWSPVTAVGDSLTITKAQGEAMSLLRRPV
ncbi:MAG: hypothetical protein ACFB16_25335 [Phormidesmis sp.]